MSIGQCAHFGLQSRVRALVKVRKQVVIQVNSHAMEFAYCEARSYVWEMLAEPEVGAFALHVAWEQWESYFFDI